MLHCSCVYCTWQSNCLRHAMEPDIGWESRFLPTPPAFDAHVRRVPIGNIHITFGTEKLEWCRWTNNEDAVIRFWIMSGLCSTTHCPSNCKDSKWKDLTLILLIGVFSMLCLHLLSKNHLNQSFCYSFLLTHNRLMRCSVSVVNAVVALLLTVFLHRC